MKTLAFCNGNFMGMCKNCCRLRNSRQHQLTVTNEINFHLILFQFFFSHGLRNYIYIHKKATVNEVKKKRNNKKRAPLRNEEKKNQRST